MAQVKVVTGYSPIPDHPRPPEKYEELGRRLLNSLNGAGHDHVSFERDPKNCWLRQHVDALGFPVTHSTGDNPLKNTLDYHCVQHQKFSWLVSAAFEHHAAENLFYVWIDYGILGVPGVDPMYINQFLAAVAGRADPDVITAPGCWPEGPIDDNFPCWRFCGGVWIVPNKLVTQLFHAVRLVAMDQIEKNKNVTWEVNTLARVEQNWGVPMRQYLADHNETMFTNF